MGKKVKNRNQNKTQNTPVTILLIDAYNVIYADPMLKEALNQNLELARNRLRDLCRFYRQTHRSSKIILVFDGDSSVGPVPEVSRERILSERDGIGEIFTQTGIKADTRIIDEVRQRSNQSGIVVVTADIDVIQECRVSGAYVIEPLEFISQCRPKPPKPKKKRQTNQGNYQNSPNEKLINHKQKEDLINEFEALFGDELDKPM